MGADQIRKGDVLCQSFKGISRGNNWIAESRAQERKIWVDCEEWGFTSRDMAQTSSEMNSSGRVSCTNRGWEKTTEDHRGVNSGMKEKTDSPKAWKVVCVSGGGGGGEACVTHWSREGCRKKTRHCRLYSKLAERKKTGVMNMWGWRGVLSSYQCLPVDWVWALGHHIIYYGKTVRRVPTGHENSGTTGSSWSVTKQRTGCWGEGRRVVTQGCLLAGKASRGISVHPLMTMKGSIPYLCPAPLSEASLVPKKSPFPKD